MRILSGQPPLTIKYAIFSKSTSPVRSVSLKEFSHILCSDTFPSESPDSNKLIVCILNLIILPVPECKTPFLIGVEEPVKIY